MPEVIVAELSICSRSDTQACPDSLYKATNVHRTMLMLEWAKVLYWLVMDRGSVYIDLGNFSLVG